MAPKSLQHGLKVKYTSHFRLKWKKSDVYFTFMQTLAELGQAVLARRKGLRLSQHDVSLRSGITRELLVRFERGQVPDFGSRKLLAVLAVLGLEMSFTEVGTSGTLDELRRERGGA